MRSASFAAERNFCKGGRPMGIYASAVALWFMAVALFLIGASIRVGFVVLGHLRNGLNSSKADADDATLIEPIRARC